MSYWVLYFSHNTQPRTRKSTGITDPTMSKEPIQVPHASIDKVSNGKDYKGTLASLAPEILTSKRIQQQAEKKHKIIWVTMMRFYDDHSTCANDDLLLRRQGIIPNALIEASSYEWAHRNNRLQRFVVFIAMICCLHTCLPMLDESRSLWVFRYSHCRIYNRPVIRPTLTFSPPGVALA